MMANQNKWPPRPERPPPLAGLASSSPFEMTSSSFMNAKATVTHRWLDRSLQVAPPEGSGGNPIRNDLHPTLPGRCKPLGELASLARLPNPPPGQTPGPPWAGRVSNPTPCGDHSPRSAPYRLAFFQRFSKVGILLVLFSWYWYSVREGTHSKHLQAKIDYTTPGSHGCRRRNGWRVSEILDPIEPSLPPTYQGYQYDPQSQSHAQYQEHRYRSPSRGAETSEHNSRTWPKSKK